jgi:hypothetical protein
MKAFFTLLFLTVAFGIAAAVMKDVGAFKNTADVLATFASICGIGSLILFFRKIANDYL